MEDSLACCCLTSCYSLLVLQVAKLCLQYHKTTYSGLYSLLFILPILLLYALFNTCTHPFVHWHCLIPALIHLYIGNQLHNDN